jgi:hypothetical protein
MEEASVRKGMPDVTLEKEEFAKRLRARFYDPAFGQAAREIETVIAIAWDAYENSRKAPRTRKAGPGYTDPDYDLSIEWIETSERIRAAQQRYDNKARPAQILIVNGSTRSEHTCPGEMSKTIGSRKSRVTSSARSQTSMRICSTSAVSHPNTAA